MLEQGKSVRSLLMSRKEQQIKRDELTTTPVPYAPVLLGGRRWRNLVKKLSLGRGVGEKCFKIWIYFSLSYCNLVGN